MFDDFWRNAALVLQRYGRTFPHRTAGPKRPSGGVPGPAVVWYLQLPSELRPDRLLYCIYQGGLHRLRFGPPATAGDGKQRQAWVSQPGDALSLQTPGPCSGASQVPTASMHFSSDAALGASRGDASRACGGAPARRDMHCSGSPCLFACFNGWRQAPGTVNGLADAGRPPAGFPAEPAGIADQIGLDPPTGWQLLAAGAGEHRVFVIPVMSGACGLVDQWGVEPKVLPGTWRLAPARTGATPAPPAWIFHQPVPAAHWAAPLGGWAAMAFGNDLGAVFNSVPCVSGARAVGQFRCALRHR